MSIVRDLVNLFVAVCASLLVLAAFVTPALGHGAFVFPSEMPVVVAVAAITILVNLVGLYADLRPGSAMDRRIELRTETGVDAISLDAIEARLLDDLSAQPDVSHARVDLSQREADQPLLCELTFRLHRVEDVSGRAAYFKQMARDSFLRLLPNGPGLEIRANVVDLLRDPAPTPPVYQQEPGEARQEFSGPVYPVSGMDQEQA